jgi:opacity protein-like surface antigen
MTQKLLMAALFGSLVLASSTSRAQNEETGRGQQITFQGTGFFTKDSNGNGINQHSTNTGGFLLSYRYYFNRWLAADASYGYNRNTAENLTLGGPLDVQANVHQATGALVVTLPVSTSRLRPYVLGGAGALVFDPTGNAGGFVPGAQRQTKAAFVYGGGADYFLTRHVSVRLEYRGFVYGRPDFGMASLRSDTTTHTAQPSAGIGIRF